MADDVAKSRSAFMNSGEEPLNGDCGAARTAAPMTTKTVVTSWATAISSVVGPDARAEPAHERGADRDADQEQHEDDREHVGGAPGAGAEEAVPGDLEAQRREARHEGERQREASRVGGRRGRAPASRRVAAASRRRRRGLGGHRRGSRAPVQHQRDRAGRPGADRPDHQRPGQPEQLDQHEARERRADDRADRVGRVQPLEGARDAAAALRQVARQRGQRRAHDQRRGRQRQDREREPHQRQRERRVREGRVDAAVHLADEPEA